MSKLLFDEPPIVFQPSLALLLGDVNKAIIVQQLHYWLRQSKHFYEGRYWVYNTYQEWHNQLPVISIRTLQRILPEMVREGLILTANFNKAGFDKTKWYTLDYEKMDRIRNPVDDVAKMAKGSSQNGDMHTANAATSITPNGRDPNRQGGDTNTKDYSKTSTETFTKNETPTPTSAQAREDGIHFWNECRKLIQMQLSNVAFLTWFERTAGISFTPDTNTLIVACPNQHHLEWLESRYWQVIKDAACQTQNCEVAVKIIVRPEEIAEPEGGDHGAT